MSNDKLDVFSKILLATSSINHMAHCVYSVNEQIKMIPNQNPVIAEGIENRSAALNQTLEKLKEAMMELGEFTDSTDCMVPIDVRITEAAFDILNGNDSVDV